MDKDELHITETVSAGENEKSDETDDNALSMMIHERSEGRFKQTSIKCPADSSIDIVQPMKKLKISEE